MSTIGTIELIARIDTSQYKRGAAELHKANKDIESSTDSAERSSGRMSGAFGAAAKAGLAAVAAGIVAVSTRVDDAVKRIDTLIAFPRVLQAMGVTAGEANRATDTLAKSLKGLPTPLQDGARAVQQFVSSGLDVGRATAAYLGINNALLATGANAQDTQVVMDSLQRVVSAGSGEVTTMQAILSRMPTVLSAISKETGKSQGELYEYFAANPQALIDNIIRLNTEGGAGMASLDKQAREATGGIGTSFSNMGNSIDRGLQSIITAIGGGSLEAGQVRLANAVSGVGKAFEVALGLAAGFVSFLITNETAVTNLAIAITGLLTPAIVRYTATMIIAGIQSLIAGARIAAGWLMALGPIGLIVAVVITAVALIIANWETVKGFVLGVWSAISSGASMAWNGIKAVFGAVIGFFSGIFTGAWNAIKGVFSGVIGFFSGIWNSIVSIFGRVGSSIADAIGGAVKSVVNRVLRGAVNIINGFIGAINGAIGIINKLPGVNIGRLGSLDVPQLASGGIVTSPTLAMIGEGRESEAVIPLSKLDRMLRGDSSGSNKSREVNLEVVNNNYTEVDTRKVINDMTWALHRI